MKRREFLQSSGSLVIGGVVLSHLPYALAAGQRRILLLGHSNHHPTYDMKNKVASEVPGEIHIFDTATLSLERITVPLKVHGFSQSPVNPFLFAGAEQWSSQGIVFDLKTRQIIRNIKCPSDFRFFGHAAFDPTGSRLYFSASRYGNDEGALIVYDTSNWSLKQTILTGGVAPHDIQIDLTRKNFLVAHSTSSGEGLGGLIVFDIASGKSVKTIELPAAGHLLQLGDGRVVVGAFVYNEKKQKSMRVVLLDLSKGVIADIQKAPQFKTELHSEALSLARLDKQNVIITVPDEKMVLFWNFEANTLRSKKIAGRPAGTYFDKDQGVIVNSDSIRATVVFKEPESRPELFATALGNGKHLFPFDVPV
jgi:hypothetical protein